ncbi:MAG TPA: restriction endonuclease [Arenimonas sp.]|uniref:restriction endonuclease n=1 Tax=Arenimonas sp. TaxID=1872635 RepID=UPI002D8057F0|nr:restriction endonuclease [Arenimonas sp.]HEU0153174.1 restriction endonuclease [Arenimonas sp.]
MPARTNYFQKLVKVINRRLSSSDAKITESAMIFDAEAETNREVDILIEGTASGLPFRIGIECTAVSKPLEIRPIEAFREKHRKLGITQTVVVTDRGFTAPAKRYADKNGIKLLTVGDATSENWLKTFKRLESLSIYGRTYFLKKVSFEVMAGDVDEAFVFDTNVHTMQGDERVPLVQFAGQTFKNAEISKLAFKQLMDNEANPDPWIEVGFTLGGAIEFVDAAGRVARPQGLVVVMGYRSKYRDLNMRSVSYDGHQLAAGGFYDKDGADFASVAINDVDGVLQGSVEVSANFVPRAPFASAKPAAST